MKPLIEQQEGFSPHEKKKLFFLNLFLNYRHFIVIINIINICIKCGIWQLISQKRQNIWLMEELVPWTKLDMQEKMLRDGESNPGLPRDRRGYSPLYYRGDVRQSLFNRYQKYHAANRIVHAGLICAYIQKYPEWGIEYVYERFKWL